MVFLPLSPFFAANLPTTTINCFCDNQGVITNLTNLNSDSITRPNDTTNNDQDIYLAITAITQQCANVDFQYIHVKGHQDKDPQHVLSVEEQHNVDCNRFAKQYVLEQDTPSTTYDTPKFEAAAPHLIIDGKLICCKVLPALWEAGAKPPYWDYLRKQFNWNQADLQNIQWSTFNLTLRSLLRKDQHHIILFIHNKLPLWTSKFHPHLGSQLCPSCCRQPEDARHFLEWNHSERHHLFAQLKRQLLAISLKYSLHPSILTTYWLGLLTIRNDTPYPEVKDDLPPPLHNVIWHQSQIGWEHLYHGQLSQEWATAIDTLNPTIAPSGIQITIYLTQAVWAYVLATWGIRNQHLHQVDGMMSIPNYQQAVITAYEMGWQLPLDAQEALFHWPLAQMLEQPPAILCTWLEQSHKYMKQQLKAAKTHAKLNTPDIRSFFCPQNQSVNDLHPP